MPGKRNLFLVAILLGCIAACYFLLRGYGAQRGLPTPTRSALSGLARLADDVENWVDKQFNVVPDPDHASPFEDVAWPEILTGTDGTPEPQRAPRVKVGGAWYELEAVHSWEIGKLLAYIEKHHGRDKVRKRFEEDLPRVLLDGWQPVKSEVWLTVRPVETDPPSARTETVPRAESKRILAAMSTENRQRLWAKRRTEEDAAKSTNSDTSGSEGERAKTQPAADASSALSEFAELLATSHSYTIAAGDADRLTLVINSLLAEHLAPMNTQAIEIAERVIGTTIDGHAGVSLVGDQKNVPRNRYLPALFFPLGDSPGSGVIAIAPSREGYLDAARPFVVAIDGVPIEECLSRESLRIPDGSSAMVRERSCRALRKSPGGRLKVVISLASRHDSDSADSRDIELPTRERVPGYGIWPRRSSGRLGSKTAYIRLADMRSDAEAMREIRGNLTKFQDCTGWIIDVRGNGGGSRATMMLVASSLIKPGSAPIVYNTAKPLRLGETDAEIDRRMASRYLRRANDPAWSRIERDAIARFESSFRILTPGIGVDSSRFGPWYYGVLSPMPSGSWWKEHRKVVVLTDNVCFSATDIFLAAMKEIEGVTLIGRPSAGGSGMARTHCLGGVLRVELSSMVSFMPDGRLFDGNGISPDIAVWPVPTDYLINGTDTVLDAAIRWLEENP